MGKVIDIRPIKKQLRADVRTSRTNMPGEIKEARDKKICNKLLNLWAVRDAQIILCYVSTPIEVDTRVFINALLKSGKRVAVPRCEGGKSEMNFYFINSLEELEEGSFNVLEPTQDNQNRVTDTRGAVCIVPAFMFDMQGFRLGYGKGYYDRYLSRYEGVTIGICYDENIANELFHGKYDRAVDTVLTERRIITVKEC